MTEPCITCGTNPRKKGRRQCGPCAWRSEDPDKVRARRKRSGPQRTEYKRRVRREAGAELKEVRRARCAQRRAEEEARRAARLAASSTERNPWLQFPDGSAERYRCRYQNDPEFAQRERERAIVFRFTHPDLAVKGDPGNHWRLAALRSDGTVTGDVVRALLRAESCYLCSIELTPANRSIDHRVALSLGGDHSASNLAPCCLPCNRKKAKHEIRQARAQRERVRTQQDGMHKNHAAGSFQLQLFAGAGDLGPQSVGES